MDLRGRHTCVASPSLIDYLSDFTVLRRGDLPSDRASITVTVTCTGVDLESLRTRAVSLGDHATLHGNASKICLLRKSLKFHRIKKERFVEDIMQRVPDGDDTDVDAFEKCISDVLYSCVEDSLDSGDSSNDR